MHNPPPENAHHQTGITRMTNKGVWAVFNELVLLANALLERKVRAEGLKGFEANNPACCNERCTKDEREGEFAGFGWPKRVQEDRNGVGQPRRIP